jgi:hypothetical protein
VSTVVRSQAELDAALEAAKTTRWADIEIRSERGVWAMTARRAFGTTAAVLLLGLPLATLTAVAGFIAADAWVNWRYRRHPNAPTTWPECDDTAELLIPEEWT